MIQFREEGGEAAVFRSASPCDMCCRCCFHKHQLNLRSFDPLLTESKRGQRTKLFNKRLITGASATGSGRGRRRRTTEHASDRHNSRQNNSSGDSFQSLSVIMLFIRLCSTIHTAAKHAASDITSSLTLSLAPGSGSPRRGSKCNKTEQKGCTCREHPS